MSKHNAAIALPQCDDEHIGTFIKTLKRIKHFFGYENTLKMFPYIDPRVLQEYQCGNHKF